MKHSISEGRIETFRPELTDARPKEAFAASLT
jgi:hypothetical protein